MTKRSKYTLIILAIGMLSGCNPEVKFLEPQPLNKGDLKTFPKKYCGKYVSKSDSSSLTIDSKIIFQEWIELSRVSDAELRKELDTMYKNDGVIQLSNNWKFTVEVDDNGDSATVESYRVDTLFVLNETNKLRTFKGYLFLNYKRPDLTWRVKTLSLENGQLGFSDLIRGYQIDTLKEITKIETIIDTASNRIDHYYLNPKRKELKEILVHKKSKSGFIKIK